MIDVHSRESELEVQIIGLQGEIDKLKRELKETREEILDDITNVETIKRYPFFYTRDTDNYLKLDKDDYKEVIKKWEAKLKEEDKP